MLVDFAVGKAHEIAESVWWENQRFVCPTARFRVVSGTNFLGSVFHFDELDTIPVAFVIYFLETSDLPYNFAFAIAKASGQIGHEFGRGFAVVEISHT